MKRIILFLLISTSLFSVDLFSGNELEKNNRDVSTIFKSISSHSIVSADFSQNKYIKKFNRTLTSTGEFIFESELGIAWNIKTPFPSITLLTKNEMIQKSSSGETRIMNSEGNESFLKFSMTIQSIFLGDYTEIFKEYHLYYQKEAGDRWTIGLIPRDSTLKSIINSFEISGKDFIENFKLNEINSDFVVYNFTNINFPEKLSEVESNVFK